MRWLLYLAGVGCLVVAMEWGGSIGAFIDPQSLIIVLAPTFLFASAFHSPLTIWNAPKHALRTDPVSAETLNASIAALISARSLSHASGGIGFLIGLVQMLQALDALLAAATAARPRSATCSPKPGSTRNRRSCAPSRCSTGSTTAASPISTR